MNHLLKYKYHQIYLQVASEQLVKLLWSHVGDLGIKQTMGVRFQCDLEHTVSYPLNLNQKVTFLLLQDVFFIYILEVIN